MSPNDALTTTGDTAPRKQRWLAGDVNEIAIIAVFLAIVAYLSLTTASFLSTPNIMSILVATSLIGLVACGQTFVIITGGIDLSPG